MPELNDVKDEVRHLAIRCGLEANMDCDVAVSTDGTVYLHPEALFRAAAEQHAVMQVLDQRGVPRKDEGGTLSLWGRINLYGKMLNAKEAGRNGRT